MAFLAVIALIGLVLAFGLRGALALILYGTGFLACMAVIIGLIIIA